MTDTTPADNVELGEQLLYLIGRLNRWSNHNADTRLPVAQARLLSAIEARENARISDLARADNCTQPAMTMQVQRLESAELVQREPDPNDARAVLISLTTHGHELLHEVRRARAQAIAPVIDQLDATEHAQLHSAMTTLSHLLHIAADDLRVPPIPEK